MISKFSVKKPYTVLVGVVLAVVLGVVSFTRMTTDLLPNISLPYVLVMTTYVGASPETVETAVTQPIEASMATVSNVESVSSVSSENYSMVILEFAQSADMNAASLEIRESLDQIKSYWDDAVGNPIIMRINPDMLPVMIAAVGMEGMNQEDLSLYVEEEIIPELESVEGAASVSATGLLEKSVNVIIRQDLVDAINARVRSAIDGEMEEAQAELADARKELADARKELADGRKEIADGQQELADRQTELTDGKEELADGKDKLAGAQEDTTARLAALQTQLLTAKADLEAAKVQMSTELATAKTLNDAVTTQLPEAKSRLAALPAGYAQAQAAYAAAAHTYDLDPDNAELAAALAQAEAGITAIKTGLLENEIVTQVKAADTSGTLSPVIADLEGRNWITRNGTEAGEIQAHMETVTSAAGNAIDRQIEDMQENLMDRTSGLSYAEYERTVNAAIAGMDKQLAEVNSGLTELEKGRMKAAIEFASGKAQISLGEYQMDLAQTQMDSAREQLDSALEQLKDGEEQLKEGEEQLKDGEEQLEEAREDAYRQSDMNNILTVDTIKNLLVAQNFSMPAGYVTEEGIDYLVRVGDKPSTVEELKALPLMDMHMDGVPVITLGDVADVFYTDNSGDIYTNVDGSAGVMLTVQKQTGYSTGEVSDLLNGRFQELMEENEGLIIMPLMDQGIYIDLVMDSIVSNVLYGGLLSIFILIVFLKDWKPTFVIACSIPISLVTAIVCMYFSGVTLNVISLSGLALGVGMLVDNSIVVIENIYRLRGEGYSMGEAALEGAREVAGAIVASTLTTVCVFLPIVFAEGITRQLFVDMGLTIGYSLLASLVVAMTVVPAMASKMLTRTKEAKEGRFFAAMLNGYEKLLSAALRCKPLVYLLVLILLVGSMVGSLAKGTAFMPDMDSTQMTVTVKLGEDATLEETGAVTDQVVEKLLEMEDVENVGAMASSSTLAMLGGGTSSTNSADIYVVTREDKTLTNEEIADILLEKTAALPAEITVETSTMDMSALGGSGITVQVRGRELDTLREIAADVADVLETVEGVSEVNNGMEDAGTELRITIDRDEAVHYGLTVAQVYTGIYAKLAEAGSATTLVAADRDYNVYVMHGSDITLTRDLVKDLTIPGTDEDGKRVDVPLAQIAAFEETEALSSISRADQTRYISVSASLADGYNISHVAAEAQKQLAQYELPDGYRLVFSGENETINDAMEQLMLMLALAIVFMYLIMVAQFQSLLSPFIIMFTIPLAFTGGFLGLIFTDSEVSVIAMIGFIMLSGIIVNNGIVIIDYMNQLRENGMEKREAILTAGRTRMRPVLMTALTTILAMCTMVFSKDMGSELARPMAVVTIGGLVYGTLLTLIVIPCVYDNFTNIGSRRRKRKAED